jgi:hypothetical protein
MRLLIDGALRSLTPLRQFMAERGLPPDFSMRRFSPKSFEGMGSVEGAGAALAEMREAVVAAVPPGLPVTAWLSAIPDWVRVFAEQFDTHNPAFGLRPVEIDFAVSSFSDVLQAWAYACVRAHLTGAALPPFAKEYDTWLAHSARVAPERQPFEHDGGLWQVQVIFCAFGRVGLRIERPDGVDYVADSQYACPAEAYTRGLLEAVAQRLVPG